VALTIRLSLPGTASENARGEESFGKLLEMASLQLLAGMTKSSVRDDCATLERDFMKAATTTPFSRMG
jgi:hypothetical protein